MMTYNIIMAQTNALRYTKN